MTVLDASALLAYLADEPGADHVQAALGHGCTIHHVNWADVLSKRAERGDEPRQLQERLTSRGLIGQLLQIDAGQPDDAVQVAELHVNTRHAGLSLGDRYCLALGRRLSAPVLTTDRAWSDLDVGVQVRLIR